MGVMEGCVECWWFRWLGISFFGSCNWLMDCSCRDWSSNLGLTLNGVMGGMCWRHGRVGGFAMGRRSLFGFRFEWRAMKENDVDD
jgi:hypothetical protein